MRIQSGHVPFWMRIRVWQVPLLRRARTKPFCQKAKVFGRLSRPPLLPRGRLAFYNTIRAMNRADQSTRERKSLVRGF